MDSKKAQSNIITIILIILMVLVLIAILWNIFSYIMGENVKTTRILSKIVNVRIGIENVNRSELLNPGPGNTIDVILTRGAEKLSLESERSVTRTVTYPVDIVFVIDVTDSMDIQINQVKATIGNFVDQLKDQGFNNRIGLISFRDYPEGVCSDPTDFVSKVNLFSDGYFTKNIVEFNNALQTLSVGGGADSPEAQLTAILNATNMPYLEKEVIILLTNSPPHAKDCYMITGNYPSDIYMYDLATSTERQITSNNLIQKNPFISGDKIVWEDYRNGNADIYMYDLAAPIPAEVQITTNTAYQLNPVISGNKIVWVDDRNGNADIYMYDLAAPIPAEVQITTNSRDQYEPSISGDKIVWADDDGDIYMYDLAAPIPAEVKITTNDENQYEPFISGNKIVWTDYRNGNADIYMYDLAAPIPAEVQITTNIAAQYSPSISGDKIVWQDNRNSNMDIYMYDLAAPTPTEVQITTNNKDQSIPFISGDKIVWQDKRNNNYDVYMYDLANPGERQITNNTKFFRGNPVIISGNKIVWDGSRYIYKTTYETCYYGPEYISTINQTLVSKDITFYYINDYTGTCVNESDPSINGSDIRMAESTGGKFFDYSDPLEVRDIILDISKDITENLKFYKAEENWGFIRGIVYNGTSTCKTEITDVLNPLETRTYQFNTCGMTNINKIDIYLVALTEDGKEVIKILDSWTA